MSSDGQERGEPTLDEIFGPDVLNEKALRESKELVDRVTPLRDNKTVVFLKDEWGSWQTGIIETILPRKQVGDDDLVNIRWHDTDSDESRRTACSIPNFLKWQEEAISKETQD